MDVVEWDDPAAIAVSRFITLIADFCRAAGLELGPVLSGGRVNIDGMAVGLLMAGPFDPEALLAVVDLGPPPFGLAGAGYRGVLEHSLLQPDCKGCLAVVPATGSYVLVTRIPVGKYHRVDGLRLLAVLKSIAANCRLADLMTSRLAAAGQPCFSEAVGWSLLV